jgi:hypothetical protein
MYCSCPALCLDASTSSQFSTHISTTIYRSYFDHNLLGMSSPVDAAVLSRDPIDFKLPDPNLKPDARLTVFDQAFHAHSTILRIYSAFFRTFLDSPDKSPASASASFRYDYVSVVDDDGTWGLEVVGNNGDVTSISQRGNDVTGNSKNSEDIESPKV